MKTPESRTATPPMTPPAQPELRALAETVRRLSIGSLLYVPMAAAVMEHCDLDAQETSAPPRRSCDHQ